MNDPAPIPRFAVVGHPNKGKSSIVSTMSQDETVQISSIPGTTVKSREFPMRVGNEILYILVDTPGFQRARRALAWMKERETSAAARPDVVREFVEAHRGTDHFPDECELLDPLINGAGILYVVDGSQPYGPEYEAEMEILRWTGSPSLALINMIGDENHVLAWRDALGQYFRIVREFNALFADFEKRLNLLRAFGEINEAWRTPLDRAITSLEDDRQRRRVRASEIVADMILDILTFTLSKRYSADTDPNTVKQPLLEKFRGGLSQRELKARKAVEAIYDYHQLDREETATDVLEADLFSESTWALWGLSKSQLVTTSAIGGAAVGASVDLAVGGADFFLGTAIGGILGAASALYTNDRLATIDVLGLPLGGNELTAGPTRNLNFPYVLLGRALYHHALIETRTHARRDALKLETRAHTFSLRNLADEHRKRLEKKFVQVRRNKLDNDTRTEVARLVLEAMDSVNLYGENNEDGVDKNLSEFS